MPKYKIRDLATCKSARNPLALWVGSRRYEEYKALLMNAVTIEGVPAHIEKFIKSCLIEQNQVGFDKITNRWAIVFGFGINEYWQPTELTFFFPNNKTSYRRPAYYKPANNGAYLIKALPTDISFSEIIEATTETMAECDISIMQNLKATRTPFVAVLKDKDLALSLEQAILQKEDGKPAVIVSEALADALQSVELNTPYIIDKVVTYRDMERDLLLNKLGIMSANINKRERVQVGEVNATVGQCVDYIYLWIDTFNKQMTDYGLSFRMKLNGALEDLYTVDVETNEESEEEEV